MANDIVISDTSSFILLDKIGEIDLLRQSFDKVYTTPVVAREFGILLPEWIIVQTPEDSVQEAKLNGLMDPGEASVLALATEIPDCYILVDDNKARRYAQQIGQKYIGTLGLILRAKRSGIIPLVRPLLEKVEQTNFWASDGIYAFIRSEAGE